MVAHRTLPDIQNVPCPKHPRTRVVRKGTRVRGLKTFQRFQCYSYTGKHTFFVEVNPSPEQETRQKERQASKEKLKEVSCLEHPGSKVTRQGFVLYPPLPPKALRQPGATYEVRTRRQRYECVPAAEVGAPHKFVPGLADAEWNAPGTVLGSATAPVLAGKAAARGYKYPLDVIAQALWDLSNGSSYVRTSIAARLAIGLPEPDAKHRRNAGRLTADWCEVFAPVLWERSENERIALAEEAQRNGFLRVLLVDDDPVYRGGARKGRSTQLYSFLAAAEVFLDPAGSRADTRLRLVRALPNHTADAYRLLLGEVGYVPDVLVTDASTSILTLVNELRGEGHTHLGWVLSAPHIAGSWRRNLAEITKQSRAAGLPFSPVRLLEQVETLEFSRSSQAWKRLTDDFEREFAASAEPTSWPVGWWGPWKPVVDAQMPLVDAWWRKGLPLSTGALETLLSGPIKGAFTGRQAYFGNVRRTAMLLNLITLQINHWLKSPQNIADLLRKDAEAAGGFAAPARRWLDSGLERSLHDAQTIQQFLDGEL